MLDMSMDMDMEMDMDMGGHMWPVHRTRYPPALRLWARCGWRRAIASPCIGAWAVRCRAPSQPGVER